MTTRLYLIRHAETIWNQEGRVQGFKDSPLTDLGKEQSKKLQPILAKKKLSAAYSSDSGRCIQTGELALMGTNLTLKLFKELRERNLGDWEGHIYKDVAANNPQAAQDYKEKPEFRPPNGESFLELQDRVFACVQSLLEKHQDQSIVIFTSGGSLRSVVMSMIQASPNSWASWATGNTGVTFLENRNGLWRFVKYNDTNHLK